MKKNKRTIKKIFFFHGFDQISIWMLLAGIVNRIIICRLCCLGFNFLHVAPLFFSSPFSRFISGFFISGKEAGYDRHGSGLKGGLTWRRRHFELQIQEVNSGNDKLAKSSKVWATFRNRKLSGAQLQLARRSPGSAVKGFPELIIHSLTRGVTQRPPLW